MDNQQPECTVTAVEARCSGACLFVWFVHVVPACLLHAFYMPFTCFLHAFYMPLCKQFLHVRFTCLLHAAYMLFTCFLHSAERGGCLLHAFYMPFTCLLQCADDVRVPFTCFFTCFLHGLCTAATAAPCPAVQCLCLRCAILCLRAADCACAMPCVAVTCLYCWHNTSIK